MAKNITDDPSQLAYGTKRFVGEVDRLSGVMDAQLSGNQYLAGDEYSIADMITWPWALLIGRMIDEAMWETYPNLKRWVDEVHARPAVDAGRKVGSDLGKRELTRSRRKGPARAAVQPDQRIRARRPRRGGTPGLVDPSVPSRRTLRWGASTSGSPDGCSWRRTRRWRRCPTRPRRRSHAPAAPRCPHP